MIIGRRARAINVPLAAVSLARRLDLLVKAAALRAAAAPRRTGLYLGGPPGTAWPTARKHAADPHQLIASGAACPVGCR